MPRITFTERRSASRERVIEVTLRRREYGGYTVVRKDNGHPLGWVVQVEEDNGKKVWRGYAGRDPFLPQGMDILAKLKAEVSSGAGVEPGSDFTYRPVVRDSGRGWAVSKLVQHLADNWAIALDPIDVKAVQAERAAAEAEAAESREGLTWAESHGRPGGELYVLRRWIAQQEAKVAQWTAELAVVEDAHGYAGYWDTNEARELCRACGETKNGALAHRQPAA